MLLYVVFILLPATALAVCDKDVYWLLYDALDPDRNNKVGRLECEIMFDAFDVNLNGEVTFEEVTARAPYIVPQLVGHEPPVFALVDQTQDGVLTRADIELDFEKTDTDEDGFKSRDEFASYLDVYCKELEAKTA